jgi:lipopolysaccharide transport system permease protein
MQVSVHIGLQLTVLGLMQLVFGGGLGPSVAWLLLMLPWLLALMMAVALGLSALGCYLRDLQHLIPLIMSGLMFLSPVLYPQSAAPAPLRVLLNLNPLSAPIEGLRAAWFGEPFLWTDAVGPLGVALIGLWLMRLLFGRLRPGFADLV